MPSAVVEVPLGLRLEFPGYRPLEIDLSALPCPELVGELARALWERTNTNGLIASPVTARAYVSAIRHLVRTLADTGFDGGPAELTEAAVFDYWRHCAPSYEGATRILLGHVEDRRPGSLQPGVLRQLAGVRLQRRAPTTPRAPYSAAETQRLLAVCRQVVEAAEARLVATEALLGSADHGVHRPGLHHPGDVDHVDHDVAVARLLDRRGPLSHQGLARLMAWRRVDGTGAEEHGVLDEIDREALQHLGGDLAASLARRCEAMFPTLEVALAMRMLLGLATGICPEGVDALGADCLEWPGPTQARIRWHKARGSGPQAHVFPSRGPWSPGRLLERWLALSARARRFAPQPERLWLYCDGAHRRLGTAAFSWASRQAFAARHGLLDDDGAPLALRFGALRATYFAAHDRHWNGALRIDPTHSARIEGDHYLTSAPSAPLEAIIEAAQRDVLHKADLAALVVLGPDELAALVEDPPAAALRLGMSPDAAGELLGGRRDVFVAACKDFYHPPHATPGQPCPSPVWTCLSCPLAVFTPSRLPNLLRLRDHLQARWEEMDSRAWMALYGAAQTRLERDILPQFPAPALAAARAVLDAPADAPDGGAGGEADGLYLPPEELGWRP